jgi:transcriptional regulator with XRE-family HTH domain
MDSTDENAFGKLIRAYRLQRGWKQEELADRWGVTREYVSQVERGKRKLENYEQVTRLADVLGIPLGKEQAMVALREEILSALRRLKD